MAILSKMKIQFENVNFDSRSGPNGFGLKLARSLIKRGHQVVNAAGDVRLSFIQSDNVSLSEGVIFIGSKRIRVEYTKPSKILISIVFLTVKAYSL